MRQSRRRERDRGRRARSTVEVVASDAVGPDARRRRSRCGSATARSATSCAQPASQSYRATVVLPGATAGGRSRSRTSSSRTTPATRSAILSGEQAASTSGEETKDAAVSPGALGLAPGWIALAAARLERGARRRQETPLSVTYGPARRDRGGRPGLPRGDLPQRARGQPASGSTCASSTPTPAATTTWSTARPRTPRPATACSAARARYTAADRRQRRARASPAPRQLAAGQSLGERVGGGERRRSTAAGRRCSRSRPSRARRSTGGACSASRSRAVRQRRQPLRGDAEPARAPQPRARRPRDRRPRADRAGARTTRRITELRFVVPADAERLDGAQLRCRQRRARARERVPVGAARRLGPGRVARERRSRSAPEERGQPAAIVLAGGEEIPNDVTCRGARPGRPRCCRCELPAAAVAAERAAAAGGRRRAAGELRRGRVRRLALERPGRRPAELRVGVRRRHQRGSGRALVHDYPGPGSYRAALRVLDGSGQVGDGAVLPFEVFVKRPPAAVAGADLVVAPGETVAFDGSALAGRRAADRALLLGFLRRQRRRGRDARATSSPRPGATS